MSTLPLAKLAELKAQLGSNLFNKALYGESSSALNEKTIQSSSNQRNIAKIATTKNAKVLFLIIITIYYFSSVLEKNHPNGRHQNFVVLRG